MSQTEFENTLSQSGTCVRSRHDAGLVGESTGRTRDDGDGLMVQVRFPGQQPRFEMAEDLEPADTELDDLHDKEVTQCTRYVVVWAAQCLGRGSLTARALQRIRLINKPLSI